MSYPLFTGIFLDEKSIEAVKQWVDTRTFGLLDFPHFYCKHITVFHRPEYPEISFSESEPVVDCFLTSFICDPYAQVFSVSLPFKAKKFPHLTYTIAGEIPSAETPPHLVELCKKNPITTPCYGNQLLKHIHQSNAGLYERSEDVIQIIIEDPIKVTGNLITVMGKSPYKPQKRLVRNVVS